MMPKRMFRVTQRFKKHELRLDFTSAQDRVGHVGYRIKHATPCSPFGSDLVQV